MRAALFFVWLIGIWVTMGIVGPSPSAWAIQMPTITHIEGNTVIPNETVLLNITTAITVVGNAEADMLIKIRRGGVELPFTTTSNSSGAYTLDINLSAGTHQLTVVASDGVGDSEPSTAATLLIDITPPTGSVTIQQTGWRTNQLYMYGHNLIYGTLSDSGGAGLDFATTTISVRNNTTNTLISGTQGHNGVNRIDFYPTTLADTQIHGHSYTISVTARDKAGNQQTLTRNYFYDGVSPAAPIITKVYDPTHNVFTGSGETALNIPDIDGYVNYFSGMTLNANPTRFKGSISPRNPYNAGFEAYTIWEHSNFCDRCYSCTVDNGCIDSGGNFIWERAGGQAFPQGLTTITFGSADSALLNGWTYLSLNFANGTPQPPGPFSPYAGSEYPIIGSRLIPTVSGQVKPMSTPQTVQVYLTTWWTNNWPGGGWYSQSQVVLPAGQTYSSTPYVYDIGDAFIDLNQNFQWDDGEPFMDSSPGGVSNGVSFSMPNISGSEYFANTYTYLVARSGNSLGASNTSNLGRMHHNDANFPTLNDVELSPVDDQVFLRSANRPTSILAKATTYGYDWYEPGYGLDYATSKIEVLNHGGTVVSSQSTAWVHTGSLKYNGTLNTNSDSFPEGRYTLRITLRDKLTNQIIDTSQHFAIDDTYPDVSNIFPGNGAVSSIPSFNAEIHDPNLPDGTPGSGANLNLTLNQIDAYRVLGLTPALAGGGSTLTVAVDSPVGGQATDHRGTPIPVSPTALPAGAAIQVWDITDLPSAQIVGMPSAIGNSTTSNATVTLNSGSNLTVQLISGTLPAGRKYAVMYLIPHFDSNDGIRKVAAVPTQPAIAQGLYASRITGLDRVGNMGTTFSTTLIQMDPPVGTLDVEITPADVYILSPFTETTPSSWIEVGAIKGSLSNTIVPDGTEVTVSVSGPGVVVEPDANGIAADGHQIETGTNGALAGYIRFRVKAADAATFGPVNIAISVGAATGSGVVTMRRPVVTMTKAVDQTSREPGQKLTYTLTVTNSGNSVANNVIVQDRLPAGVTYDPNSTYLNGSLQGDTVFNPSLGPSGQISVNVGSLMAPPGAGATATISFRVSVN